MEGIKKYKSNWSAMGFPRYKDYLRSPLWKSKRDYLLNKVKKCEICKSKKSLSVHHKNYKSAGNEKRRDLLVVCRSCHEKAHGLKI